MNIADLKPQLKPVSWLKPYPNNVKVHDKHQVSKIAASIKEFGWTTSILVEPDGTIVAGHGRRLAAIELGQEKVPVIVLEGFSQEQFKALRLADNRVSLSAYDGEALKRELESIDLDMSSIFDAKELSFMEADLGIVDTDNFMDDIDTAVREQAAETTQKVAAVDEKDVPIAKALGFKAIKKKDEKHVATFLALIEEETGKTGQEAFVEFCANYGS